VEDKSFYSWAQQQPDKAKTQIAAVRECTGEQDEEKIKAVLDRVRQESGTFSLNTAVDYLLRGEGASGGDSMAPAQVMSPAQPVTAQQAAKPKVVDLTEENKSEDDLQRAIALSLQDGGVSSSRTTETAALQHHAASGTNTQVSGVSQEEQDVSKALEASLLESAGARRKRDPQNPHDREREADWPVGLKNVGQTCWFSAVIQSLFHLPAFRVLVLNFDPPQHQPKSEKERKILEFMSELRKLFALLLGSQRKYVDPSRAVGILKGSLGGEGATQNNMGYDNNQQDVSEFTHKLLDWLEEAFKVTPEEEEKGKTVENSSDKHETPTKDSTNKEEEPMESECEKTDPEKESVDSTSSRVTDKINPMYSLFYGKVKIEGRNLGVDFSRTEQFGQWPLQVNGYKDIHESLEASTAAENIDSGSGVERGSQERWFTSLPPVLFLELSRFQFNTSRGIAEKVNNVLEFPQLIYLDRYLEENKVVTRLKREQVHQLKTRRDSLNTQLDGFLRYKTSDESESEAKERFPLANVLTLALEFAKSGAGQSDTGPDSHAMQVDSPCPSPASLTPANSVANLCTEVLSQGSPSTAVPSSHPSPKVLPDGSVSIPIVRQEAPESSTAMEVEHPATPAPCSTSAMVSSTQSVVPRPSHVSDLELKVLSGCLQRWRSEVEEQMASLNRDIKDMESQIAAMYEEQQLRNRGYRLHAVMVHEGDVNQGHYWAYVFHPGRKVWLKFNDNTVSETSWAELSREGQGGRASTSAYSCVYVDMNRQELINEAEQGQNTAVSQLSADLDQFLLEDNKAFAGEILRWDEEQIRKEKEAEQGTDAGEGKPEGPENRSVLIGDDPECQIIESTPDLSTSHALLSKEVTVEVLKTLANTPPEKRKEQTRGNTASYVINKIYQQVKNTVHSAREQGGLGERGDPRLEGFLHYLVANDLTVDLYRRALLEQVSLSEYDNLGEVGKSVASLARNNIKEGEQEKTTEDILLWHRAYHQFRIACNYYVVGVEKYTDNCLEEALELLTTSYVVNEKILEDPPSTHMSSMKIMNKRGLVRHFHLAVEALNTRLVEQFETGDDPASVAARVATILVPAIHILQARTNAPGSSGRDPGLLEEVRGRWCAMIEQPLPDRKRDYWGTIFNTVVPDDNQVVMKQPTNLRYPKLADDLRLGLRYKAAMQRIMREQTAEKYVM